MKIVYCIYQLGVGGGVERVLTSKVNWLVEHGHEVEIVTCDYDGRPSTYGIDPRIKVTDFGIDYAADFRVPLWKRGLNTWSKMRRHKRLMRDYLTVSRPDIVVTTHLVEMSFLPSLRDGSKKVLELHASALMYQKEKSPSPYSLRQLLVKLYEWRDRYNLSRFDAVGCLTEEDMELRGKPSNHHVIPNPMPFEPIGQSNLDNKVVLAMGRFGVQKDFPALIDIWSKVASQHPDWCLRIVGDGPDRQGLEAQAASLGLTRCVHILPYTSDVQAQYLSADIYAMTSRFEGFGMVLIEAMSLGVPVVSYSCPCGPRDIITDGGDGYLIPPGDQVAFAQRLSQLISDTDLRQRMGQAALSSTKRYTLDSVMQQWTELFTSLVKQ